MKKFVIDIKAVDDRLVIVDARSGRELYEIEANDSENCEADRLIDKLDEGISDVMRYRENALIARKEKAAMEAAQAEENTAESDVPVINNSLDYFKAVSDVMAAYSEVFNLDADIAMKNIVDMAIQFNVDSNELGTIVYAYMQERRKMLSAVLLENLINSNIRGRFSR
jgi:hypothetical protein